MSDNSNLEQKLNALIDYFAGKRVIVAFSGGVDSSLLAYLAKLYASEALLITETSFLYAEEETQGSQRFAETYDIPQEFLDYDPLADPCFLSNPPDRCYYCKRGLYEAINRIKEERGFDLIVDGSNYDDLQDYRPGMRAVQDLNIITPYIDLQIHKNEIRQMCESFGLPTYSKPSMACLSSRVSYSLRITPEIIARIQQAESYLKKNFNLEQVRVRAHPDRLARIEICPEDWEQFFSPPILQEIAKEFKKYGFCYVTFDLEGFRSGSMNEILDGNENATPLQEESKDEDIA